MATAFPEEHLRRRSRYQHRWLVAYWCAASLNILFLVLALTGEDVPGTAVLAVALGAVASVTSTLMASSLFRRGITDLEFDEATSAMRVIVVAWAVLVLVMVVGTWVGTGGGLANTAGSGATETAVGVSQSAAGVLFGLAAMFVVAGDGYTKYRRLTAQGR